jgi:glycerol-3-phosphate acyltransferase PlsY
LLGNLFPLFHRFKGGKGVAAAVGAFLALSPPVMLLGGGVFIAVYAVWRRVSAGSLAMVCAYPLLSWWLDGRPALVAVSVTVSLVLFFTHRANLARLFRGEEPRTDIGRRANHAP